MDAIAKLVAIEDIRQLKSRYFRCMDLRDWEGMGQTFTKDALFDYTVGLAVPDADGTPPAPDGPVWRGRETIMATAQQVYAQTISVHHGHCHEISIDSETEAHGVIAMESWSRGPDRTTKLNRTRGHYVEKYRYEDGAWRIAESKVVPLFKGEDA
jgi:hypothetical protein